jgi:hypothetical protein
MHLASNQPLQFRSRLASSSYILTKIITIPLRAVRFCATLKAVGVNLFRATAVRRARSRAAVTGPGPKSPLAQLIFLVKEQI